MSDYSETRRLAEQFRAHCHDQARRWRRDGESDGIVDLWMNRAEAMTSFIQSLEIVNEALDGDDDE